MKFVSSCKNNPSHEFDYIIEKKESQRWTNV